MSQQISISNKHCSFELSINQIILKKNVSVSYIKKYEAVQQFIFIDNYNKCFLSRKAEKQYIRIISEGSCDTEDWINDAKNADLITEIHFDNIQIEKKLF